MYRALTRSISTFFSGFAGGFMMKANRSRYPCNSYRSKPECDLRKLFNSAHAWFTCFKGLSLSSIFFNSWALYFSSFRFKPEIRTEWDRSLSWTRVEPGWICELNASKYLYVMVCPDVLHISPAFGSRRFRSRCTSYCGISLCILSRWSVALRFYWHSSRFHRSGHARKERYSLGMLAGL